MQCVLASTETSPAPGQPAATSIRQVTTLPPPSGPSHPDQARYPFVPAGYPPPWPVAPRPTSTKGPKITFFVGLGALVLTIGLAVLSAVSFWNTLPTDVLRFDGSAGSDVLGAVPAPGSAEVTLPEAREYALYLVNRSSAASTLDGPIVVTAPDSSDVRVQPNVVSSTVTMGSTRAVAIGVIDAGAPGTYRIDAPATIDGSDAALYVVESAGFGSFMGGVFGTVVAAIAAAFLGVVALALLVTGGIMWGVRRGNARTVGAA